MRAAIQLEGWSVNSSSKRNCSRLRDIGRAKLRRRIYESNPAAARRKRAFAACARELQLNLVLQRGRRKPSRVAPGQLLQLAEVRSATARKKRTFAGRAQRAVAQKSCLFGPVKASAGSSFLQERTFKEKSINNPIFDLIRSLINNQIYDLLFPIFNLDFPF